MCPVRSNIPQREKHEGPGVHSRMWHDRPGTLVTHGAVEIQKVQVKCSRRVRGPSDASERRLDLV